MDSTSKCSNCRSDFLDQQRTCKYCNFSFCQKCILPDSYCQVCRRIDDLLSTEKASKNSLSVKELKEISKAFSIPLKVMEKDEFAALIFNTLIKEPITDDQFMIYRMNRGAMLSQLNHNPSIQPQGSTNHGSPNQANNGHGSTHQGPSNQANNSQGSTTQNHGSPNQQNNGQDRNQGTNTTNNNTNNSHPLPPNPFKDISDAVRTATDAFNDTSSVFKDFRKKFFGAYDKATIPRPPSTTASQADDTRPPPDSASQATAPRPPPDSASQADDTRPRRSDQSSTDGFTNQSPTNSNNLQNVSSSQTTNNSSNQAHNTASYSSAQQDSHARSTSEQSPPLHNFPVYIDTDIDPPSIATLVSTGSDVSRLSTKALKRILLRERVSTLDINDKEELVKRVQNLVSNLGKDIASATTNPDNICKICCERPINAVILECGHFVCCVECAADIQRTSHECPICRSRIVRIIHTFRS